MCPPMRIETKPRSTARITRLARRCPATLCLGAVVSLVAVAEASCPGTGDLDSPTRKLGWSTHDVIRGQWWRPLTANLVNPANNGLHVHTSAASHYASNLLGLVVLGSALERRVGWRWFAVIAAVAGGTAFGSLALTNPDGRVYDGGTSGIIAGLGGALIVLLWQQRRVSRAARRWWRTAVTVVLLLVLVSTTWATNVNQVHGVSFIVGASIAASLRPPRGLSRPRAVAAVFAVLTIITVAYRTIERHFVGVSSFEGKSSPSSRLGYTRLPRWRQA